jgi:hypothetical protein
LKFLFYDLVDAARRRREQRRAISWAKLSRFSRFDRRLAVCGVVGSAAVMLAAGWSNRRKNEMHIWFHRKIENSLLHRV